MKKFFLILILAVSVALPNAMSAQTVTVAGAKIPAKLGFSETVRVLNGAGVRQKYFVRVYVGALYLKEKSKDPQAIINADKPMSVRLHIISSMLTNEVMANYIREGFSRSLGGKTEPIEEEINLICDVFMSEPTKVGDVYDIHYTPGVGISASKNSKPYSFESLDKKFQKEVASSAKLNHKMKTLNKTKDGQMAIPGLDFKKALFGIWLSNDPVDPALKKAMLGL